MDEAIASYRKALALNPKQAAANTNLGIAFMGKGQLDEAVACYQKAIELDPTYAAARARLAEAQRLAATREKAAAFRNGSYTPASNQERLGLVVWCQIQKLHRTSSRLYAEAFAADPKLADDLAAAHRYNAAGSAAQAAAGQGADAAELDEQKRLDCGNKCSAGSGPTWRRGTKEMETAKPPDRAKGQKQLQHWQDDPKLAGVRDREVLAKLPEGERKEWQALWAEVQALMDGAAKEAH